MPWRPGPEVPRGGSTGEPLTSCIADAKLVVTSRRLPVTSKGLPVPGRLLDAETGEEVMSWATLEDLPPLV
ncbi:MAG: hypothetical protein FWF90_05405 [Promicromonosporaceae bacterium]|nr:hypothetical protein [Promicromonosporaceae bacterium]